MLQQRVFIRCDFGEKKIKKKDGTIKTKKILVYNRDDQSFEKEDVPYAWQYNPVTKGTVFKGFILLGCIVACAALPLWPVWLRNWVAGFLLFIVLGRPMIWLAIYLITFSRWNFMIMPKSVLAAYPLPAFVLSIIALLRACCSF